MSGSTAVDSVFARVINAPTLQGTEQEEPELSAAGQFIIIMDDNDSVLKASVNGGAFEAFTMGGLAAITLDAAYNGGRTITVDAGAVVLDNRQTTGTVMSFASGAAVVLTGALIGVNLDLSTNVTPGANAVQGIVMNLPASTSVDTLGWKFTSTSTNGGIVRALVKYTQGVLIDASWSTATTLAGPMTGIVLNMLSNVTGGSQDVVGITLSMPRAVSASSRGLSITAANQAGIGAEVLITAQSGAVGGLYVRAVDNGVTSGTYLATFDWRVAAGTAAGNGIVNIEVGAATVLTGRLVGLECDLLTNNTPGANACIGINMSIPATTVAANGAIVVASQATRQSVLRATVRNLNGQIVSISYDNATALTASLTGIDLNLGSLVTGGAVNVVGVQITMPGTSDASSAGLLIAAANTGGFGALIACNGAGATTGLSIDMGNGAFAAKGLLVTMGSTTTSAGYAATYNWLATAGTAAGNGIVNIEVGAATVLTGRLTGLECDLLTNVTAGAQIIVGINVSLPSTTDATASAAINATIPTADEDTIPYFRLGGTRVFFDEGSPNNANGSDGDWYFKKDAGAANAALYVRIGGTWSAV